MRIDELVLRFNEKFNLNKFTIIGLDGSTILFSSKNDGYGITWDIMTREIESFEHGHKIGYLINEHGMNRKEKVNINNQQDLIASLARCVRKESDVRELVDKKIQTEIYNEDYETVIKLREFLDIIN